MGAIDKPPAGPMLRLFVYGTLKRGQRNHQRFCTSVVQIEGTAVRGRLYDLPAGYPMLVIPPESILAMGTADALADLATQQHYSAANLLRDDPQRNEPAAAGDAVPGEVLWFANPVESLRRIDELENFRPGESSLYHRVLVWPIPASLGPVWVYVGADGQLPSGARQVRSWP